MPTPLYKPYPSYLHKLNPHKPYTFSYSVYYSFDIKRVIFTTVILLLPSYAQSEDIWIR